ncbi:MAG: sugar kinase [Pseudomonadota bacterium]
MHNVLSVGECMVEFSRAPDGAWAQGFAGDTLNVAWAMRALLPQSEWRVKYFTRVGKDDFSNAMVSFLDNEDIDTSCVQRDAERSPGLYTIETDARGERRFHYWRSQSAARTLADDAGAFDAAFQSANLIYLSGITLAILAPDARRTLLDCLGKRDERSWSVAFDPNIRPALWDDENTMRDVITEAASISDIVLPTFDDEQMAFGDTNPEASLKRYAALGCSEVVVKDGTGDTLSQVDKETLRHCVVTPVDAVDTTGAGDSFNGAYLAARLRGQNVDDAVRAAQSVAALVVSQRGALIAKAEIAEACDLS